MSVCMYGAVFPKGRLEKYEMKEKRKRIVSQCDICVCVFALKREDSCAEHTGRGETLFLPSCDFLLNSCVSMGGWGT